MQFEGSEHGLQDAGGGMAQLNFRTSNWSVRPLFCSRCHGSLTENVILTFCHVKLSRVTRISHANPTNHAL